MKKALAITLAILFGLLLSTAIRAETLKKNLVPADASWVIHLDLEQLLSSRFFNHIIGTEGWDEVEKKNATFEKKFRINLLKDIKGVTVYGKGHDEESAVVCISGRLDKDHLLYLLGMDEAHKEIPYAGFTMHNWDGEAFGAFVGNDLAVITKGEDILKHALMQYDGTLIVVSHDREFLDGLVEKVYEFGERRVREHMGGIYDFLDRKKLLNLKDIEKIVSTGEEKSVIKGSGNKQQYQKRKELDRRERSLARKVEQAEVKISKLEAEINELNELMQEPEKIGDSSVFSRYEQLKKELNDEMWNWEKYQSQLERMKENRN